YFPISWKRAKVIPIPKPGKKPEEISSYRPISLNTNINNNWIDKFKTGYIPPQAFTLADKLGILQDDMNVPIIYHIRRHKASKKLPSSYEELENFSPVYSKAIPNRDFNDMHRINNKYWWLQADAKHLDELRKRAKFKRQKKNNDHQGH
ncbi:hypothetical protein PV325_012361, partial [Microctonus aethiopoides]